MESLLHNIEPALDTSGMAGTTFVAGGQKGPWIDMSDADGCLFMVVGSSQVGSSKITASFLGSSISSSTGTNCHTYSVTAISSSTGFGKAVTAPFDYKLLMVDVLKPKYRYCRMVIKGTTGIGGAFGNYKFLAIKHHMRHKGSTTLWDSTTIGLGCSTIYASPTT